MNSLFCYGTLRCPDLRAIVLGRDVDSRDATLCGYLALEVPGEPYPTIREGEGSIVGTLLQGLTEEDLDRLNFYEGGFGYSLRAVQVVTDIGPVDTVVYFPDAPMPVGGPWSLSDWQDTWGRMSCLAATEAMSRFGKTGGESVATLLPFFRNRAWSKILAGAPTARSIRSDLTQERDVEILDLHEGYDGFFRLQPFTLRYRQFDGSWGKPLRRECFMAYDVALVLPYDPISDQILLTEQCRFGPIHRGDSAPWVLEPVAGMIDAGETPEEAARREAVEEAGLQLDELLPISTGYASPGYSTEFYHTFIGLCDLSNRASRSQAGLASENEDIRNHVISFDKALDLVASGEINAVPLQMLIFALAGRRESLRKK
ncbi:gamma-glutamylcyclotransferase [Sagittula sp. SSi028]|uniref:gamma-glutamylcyclotransferase n=1 Tax=Sagittula sp. SSi028 TaxID=3400636 RepID=UPI003AF9D9BA